MRMATTNAATTDRRSYRIEFLDTRASVALADFEVGAVEGRRLSALARGLEPQLCRGVMVFGATPAAHAAGLASSLAIGGGGAGASGAPTVPTTGAVEVRVGGRGVARFGRLSPPARAALACLLTFAAGVSVAGRERPAEVQETATKRSRP
jgi:hypothetical protein